MVPLRPASLFRSRWAALFYAAGVLWFAVDVSGVREAAPDNGATNASAGSGDADADLNTLEARVHALESMK